MTQPYQTAYILFLFQLTRIVHVSFFILFPMHSDFFYSNMENGGIEQTQDYLPFFVQQQTKAR